MPLVFNKCYFGIRFGLKKKNIFSNYVKSETHRVPKFQLNILRAGWKKHLA